MHEAIALLRREALEDEYVQAWAEWDASGENQVWETVDRQTVVSDAVAVTCTSSTSNPPRRH